MPPPWTVTGLVEVLHDGTYIEEAPRHGGIRKNDQGLTAVVGARRARTWLCSTRCVIRRSASAS